MEGSAGDGKGVEQTSIWKLQVSHTMRKMTIRQNSEATKAQSLLVEV